MKWPEPKRDNRAIREMALHDILLELDVIHQQVQDILDARMEMMVAQNELQDRARKALVLYRQVLDDGYEVP